MTAFAAAPAFADPCTAAQPQIAMVLRQLDRNEVDAAELALRAIETAHPDCLETVLARAQIAAAKGDASQAGNLFVSYFQQAPDDPRGAAYFARFLIEQRQYQQADNLSAFAFDKAPNDPSVLAVRGQILVMKGQAQEGTKLLETACQLDPENADAQFELGAVYDRAKRPADAVKHFQKVVALDPNDARAWDYLALNLEPLGEIERADQAYRKAMATNSPGWHHDAFVDYNYGRFLMKRNDPAASKQHLDRAVELTPLLRAPWYERAKLNLRLKNYPQARADAEKAAGIDDPGGIIIDLQIYSLLETIYGRLGETELARKYAVLSRDTSVPARADRR